MTEKIFVPMTRHRRAGFWIWLNDHVAKKLRWAWLTQFCYSREGHYWDTHNLYTGKRLSKEPEWKTSVKS